MVWQLPDLMWYLSQWHCYDLCKEIGAQMHRIMLISCGSSAGAELAAADEQTAHKESFGSCGYNLIPDYCYE